jgi:MFS family permease
MNLVSRLVRWWDTVPTRARVVLAADLLSNTGTGLVVAFTAVYVARVHQHGPTAGALAVAAIAVGSIPSNALAGWVADRRSPLTVLAGGWAVAAMGDLALVAASGAVALLAACVLVGLGVGAATPSLNALLGQLTDGEVRRTVFGAHHGLLNVGFSVGALAAAIIVSRGTLTRFHVLYLLDALSFLAAAALLIPVRGPRLAAGRAPARAHEPGSYRQVLADRSFRKLCVISGLLVVFGFSQFHAALPLLLSRPGGLHPGAIAVVFAANTITVAGAALPVALATKRAGRMTLIAGGSVLFAACWALLFISDHLGGGTAQLVWAVVAAAVMALGETLLSPSMAPLVNELAPEALRGRYNAVDSLVLSFGTLTGPVLAGVLLSGAGPFALLAVLVGGCLLAAGVGAAARGGRSIRPAATPKLLPLAQPTAAGS